MKVRRIVSIIMAFVLVMSFTSCSKSQPEYTKREKMLIDQSVNIIQDMFDGNYETFNEFLSKNSNTNGLYGDIGSLITDTTNMFGKCEEIAKTKAITSSSGITVFTTLKCERGAFGLNFVYDENNRIIDFSPAMTELYEPQSTKEFEEISIEVGKDPYILDGLLTKPKGKKRVNAVVVLVHPSGPKGMNTTEGGVQPFKDIAHGLAKQGITTIRYNQRLYQYPSNNKLPSVSEEILEDVSHAIDLASTHKDLKGYKVYIAGHSMGGLLVPKISLENEEVDGFISLAGSPRNYFDIIYDQEVALINSDETKTQGEKDILIQARQNFRDENKSQNTSEQVDQFSASMNAIDTPEILEQLDIPMLFLQGTKDFSVYYDIDFVEWQTLLDGYDKAEFKLYDGLNHLFCKSKGLPFPEEYADEAHVEQVVIDDMVSWIAKLAN